MIEIPLEVRKAIAAAQASLYGIPQHPEDAIGFDTACDTVREWAADNLSDDPTEEQDEEGNWHHIHYDYDDPWRSRETKLRSIVGTDLYQHVR